MSAMSALLFLVGLQLVAAAVSPDSVTLRYYGRRPGNFIKTKNWPDPTEVCHTFMAVCVDIRLGECLPAHPEMFVPHTRIVTDNKASLHHIKPPAEAGQGTYVMTEQGKPFTGEAGNTGLKLWSGCDSTCKNCHEGSGFAHDEVKVPYMCEATADGGVYALVYNKNDGTASTTHDCVNSLTAYYAGTEDAKDTKANVTWIIIGSCIGLVVLGILGVALRFGWLKRREEVRISEALRTRTAEFRLPASASQPSRTVSQTAIEDRFPTSFATDGPVCVVCLNAVALHDETRRLQCNHVFHANCILSWWLHKPRQMLECPVCRMHQTMTDDEVRQPTANTGDATAPPPPGPQGSGKEMEMEPQTLGNQA